MLIVLLFCALRNLSTVASLAVHPELGVLPRDDQLPTKLSLDSSNDFFPNTSIVVDAEEFPIPESDLIVSIDFRRGRLIPSDLHQNLFSATLWVTGQRQDRDIPNQGFSWPAYGIKFVIRPLSAQMNWGSVNKILRGLIGILCTGNRAYENDFIMTRGTGQDRRAIARGIVLSQASTTTSSVRFPLETEFPAQ